MRTRVRRIFASGEPFIWLTGGALTLSLLLVAGLIGLILYNGLGFFWPRDVLRAALTDGKTLTGQIVDREAVPGPAGRYRIKLKVANRDLYGADFVWVDEEQIRRREYPPDVAVIERTEWGLLIGTLKEVRDGGRPVAVGAGAAWDELQRRLPDAARVRREIQRIETDAIGAINARQEKIRLRLKGLELKGISAGPDVEALKAQLAPLQEQYAVEEARLGELRKSQSATVVVVADGGKEKELPIAQVVDVRFPNGMGGIAKSAYYAGRVWEFVSDDPRESNTEG